MSAASSGTHSVAVSVRIRPGGSAVAPSAGGGIACRGHSFAYPHSVLCGSDQPGVGTELLSRLVRQFVRGGISCTLMAYGQTGSGKTYTMFGPTGALTEASLDQASSAVPELWGCFPRAMMELLGAPELAGATFHASAIEIYMEHAYDLLDGRKSVKVGSAKGSGRGTLVVADMGKAPVWSGDVQIVGGVHPSGCSCFKCFQKTGGLVGKSRLADQTGAAAKKPGVPRQAAKAAAGFSKAAGATSGEQFGVEGETMWPMRTAADVAKLARLVESERVAHSHALNDRSSRSHCLIRVHCTLVEGGSTRKRLFLFVDLAGSERIAKTEVTGARAREASNINQSLTALGRVINELNHRAAHVSFRDSALTMLLRASFDGPSCTSVVINVSGEEEHAEESVCSLRFGEKLASVKTSAEVARPADVSAQRAQVGAELRAARARLAELERAGQGEHMVAGAPPSEQATLRKNMATLAEREAEVRRLRVELVEARASTRAGGAAELAARLESAVAAHRNVDEIVEREKTIKTLWSPATPAYTRAETLVTTLAAQMEMLGV